MNVATEGVLVYVATYGNIIVDHDNPTWNGKPVPKDVWQRGLRLQLKGFTPDRCSYVDEWMYYQETKDEYTILQETND